MLGKKYWLHKGKKFIKFPLTNQSKCAIMIIESEETTMRKKLLNVGKLDYYEIHDLRIILEKLVDEGISNITIKELLKDVKEIEEKIAQNVL